MSLSFEKSPWSMPTTEFPSPMPPTTFAYCEFSSGTKMECRPAEKLTHAGSSSAWCLRSIIVSKIAVKLFIWLSAADFPPETTQYSVTLPLLIAASLLVLQFFLFFFYFFYFFYFCIFIDKLSMTCIY